jgi:hypothetical protein
MNCTITGIPFCLTYSRDLLGEGWLTEADLIGLQKDKIERIKIDANLYLQ